MHVEDDYSRTVVGGLGGRRASELSVTAAASNLLDESDWATRLTLLAADPRLVDGAVAVWCAQQGDDLLGALIRRAEDVGVEAAGRELPVVLELVRISAVDPSEQTVDDLIRLIGTIRDTGAQWSLSWLVASVEHVAAHPVGRQMRLTDAVEPLLTEVAGCDPASVLRARDLATAGWDSVWEQLATLTDIAALRAACGVVAQITHWFGSDQRVSGWAVELGDLLAAVEQRGTEAAVLEHRMVLNARAAPTSTEVEESQRAETCGQIAAVSGEYFQRTGAVWVLRGALGAAHAAWALTAEAHPGRASRASSLGGLLAYAIQSGIRPPAAHTEAVERLREACTRTSEASPNRALYASNLGAEIFAAVQAGVLPLVALTEAVERLREAYTSTSEASPNRALYASNLGGLLSTAVQAGVLPLVALTEAVERLREACTGTPETHPDRAGRASNLGTVLSTAVQAGVLPLVALTEAVERLREAYTSTSEASPNRALYASNLGTVLAQAVQAGVLTTDAFIEAVERQREAYTLTPETHPDRAGHASNLGTVLSSAVRAGVLLPVALTEAVERQREAYALTAETHPNRAFFASNLGTVLSEAVQAGVLLPVALTEAVERLREAYTSTSEASPNRALYASNLGGLLSSAVRAGVLLPVALTEAVERLREAYTLTPASSHNRALYASNLGNSLSVAVQAGALLPGALTEAVERQREAYALTPASSPNRALYASNLGSVLAQAVQAGVLTTDAFIEAVERQREAYTLTPETHPDRAYRASNLGALLAVAGEASEFNPAHAVEVLSGLVDEVWRLSRAGVTPTHRRRVLTATQGIAATVPLRLAHIAGAAEAARAVETLRGHLSAGMHAPFLPDGLVSQDLAVAYRVTAARYERSQQRAREGITDYAAAAPAATALADLVEEVRRSTPALADFGGRPQLTDLTSRLASGSAGIYLIPGQADSPGAAIVLRSDTLPATIPLPDLTGQAVNKRASSLLSRRVDLPELCAWMWDTIVGPLLPELEDVSDWVVIPTGYLGLLPLHAAGSDLLRKAPDGSETPRGWLDDHATIRTAPSLLALDQATGAPPATGTPLVAISDAIDLEFLKADRVIAQHLIPGARPLDGEVSPDSVLRSLVEAPVAVISGHAAHSLTEGGGLALGEDPPGSDGKPVPRWLTAEAVERLPLRDRDLVVLSSCSSGQIATDLPDETIGLPAAFLRVGFASVIATSWPVGDWVAFVTLTRLLQLRATHPDQPPATTLRNTRRWLRTATRDELLTWLDTLESSTPGLPPDPIARLRDWWTGTPDPYPMSDPRDWAPYGCTGR